VKNIRDYARIGIVHHLLYPKCTMDADDHVRTLTDFIKRNDIETFDCCLPYGKARRDALIPLIRDCGKVNITFATHLYPARSISFASVSPSDQEQARMIVSDMIDMAIAIGATGFIFPSGGPSPGDATEKNHAAFADFCKWLCQKLSTHDIVALLEPFDMTIDKKFLYGPTQKCVELIQSLEPEIKNLAIELDVAHLPLMGEPFAQAIKTSAPYLKRIHIGNCVMQDKTNPLYGDMHPPVGIPGGEIDVPQLVGILRCLLDVGFLNQENRGDLILEMTPWPGKSADKTVADTFTRLEDAWSRI
jgi:sugar phosphate isomerase/epimerase